MNRRNALITTVAACTAGILALLLSDSDRGHDFEQAWTPSAKPTQFPFEATGIGNAIVSSPSAADPHSTLRAFDLQRDLWAFYRQAAGSARPDIVSQAVRSTMECAGFLEFHDHHYGVIAGGGVDEHVREPVEQARRDAILELVRRCSGFTRMNNQERRTIVRTLTDRARNLGSPEVKFREHGVDSMVASDVIEMLSHPSGSNFDALVSPTSNIVTHRLVTSGIEARRAEMLGGIAALLSLCDLSETCHPDSLRSLIGCAMGGPCGQSLTVGWDTSLSARDRAVVEDGRSWFVESVRQGNWEALGLQ